jgi:hypothetical protein
MSELSNGTKKHTLKSRETIPLKCEIMQPQIPNIADTSKCKSSVTVIVHKKSFRS